MVTKHFRIFGVMPGLVPGIHVFLLCGKDVDGRDKPGHDGEGSA
jgi:2-oxoglutarate ferredoxin oxidoreductase subunit beta